MTNLKPSASNERHLLDTNILITWFWWCKKVTKSTQFWSTTFHWHQGCFSSLLEIKANNLNNLDWSLKHSHICSDLICKSWKTEGKRRRRWQKMRWLESITDSMNMNLSINLGNSGGQGSLVCCSPWGRKSQMWLSDWTISTTLQMSPFPPIYPYQEI